MVIVSQRLIRGETGKRLPAVGVTWVWRSDWSRGTNWEPATCRPRNETC